MKEIRRYWWNLIAFRRKHKIKLLLVWHFICFIYQCLIKVSLLISEDDTAFKLNWIHLILLFIFSYIPHRRDDNDILWNNKTSGKFLIILFNIKAINNALLIVQNCEKNETPPTTCCMFWIAIFYYNIIVKIEDLVSLRCIIIYNLVYVDCLILYLHIYKKNKTNQRHLIKISHLV